MKETDKQIVREIVQEEIKKELPKITGRSNVQLREYLLDNII